MKLALWFASVGEVMEQIVQNLFAAGAARTGEGVLKIAVASGKEQVKLLSLLRWSVI